MIAKVVSLFLLVAAVQAASYYKPKQYQQSAPPAEHDIDYKVKWTVKDEPSYNYQTRDESRYADKVEGSYSLVEADGTLRIVTYTADANGFVAHVENKPLTFEAPKYEAPKYEARQESQSQYQQSAPQQSSYQQSAPQQSSYQQSAPQQSSYQQSAPPQASEPEGVTIFSAPPAPAKPNDQATLFSAPAKPTFSQASEVNFRPKANNFRPTLNFQPQQTEGSSRYH